MKEILQFMTESLDDIDNNPKQTMRFITQATASTTISNKPPDDIRYRLLINILYSFGLHSLYGGDQELSQQFADDTLLKISNKYEGNQHLCWKAHEHHFHETFQAYVNCPITCVCELSEFLDKLRRQCYAG